MNVATVAADILLWRVAYPGGAGPGIRTSLTEAEGQALQQLATGARVLEFGAAYGYSTVMMGMVARRVVSVDPHTGLPGSAAIQARNVEAYGLAGRVELVASTSAAACEWLTPGFGLVFIDGDHSYEGAAGDLACAAGLVRSNGWVAVHDFTRIPDVQRAVENSGLPVVALVDTLAILRRS